MLRNLPIRRKLISMLLLTSGTVLLLTCLSFIVYEFLTFRQTMVRNVGTLGSVVATNSTAALAFDNQSDASEILAALRAEQHIVAAALYDAEGRLFASYPSRVDPASLPNKPGQDGYRFEPPFLIGFAPVQEGSNKRLGTLYLRADQHALDTQLRNYSVIAIAMTALAFLVAYLLARRLQSQISKPLLALAHTASVISTRHDYSVRAAKFSTDEIGSLTDAFNKMLAQIQAQDREVRNSEARVRAVLNSAMSAVVVIDGSGFIIDWNPPAERIFGWERAEVVGKELAEFIIPPRFREQHRRGLQRYLETGEGQILNRLLELSALRRDGSEFPAEVCVSPLGSGAETFCGFITDISERKQAQDKLQAQLQRLDLLHRITRAIGERQTLDSIFDTVIRSIEERLPLDFACICLYDALKGTLTVNTVGERSALLAAQTSLHEQAVIEVASSGLSRCVQGELLYEADVAVVPLPFARHLAAGDLHSVVITPLLAESRVFGTLIAARKVREGFSSSDCEFLRQLSEHTALAAHHAQLYSDLESAYQELRHSQQTLLQQERLRALGQMASGVAHDINNAISPISLYTESLLTHEAGLSERARGYLQTIQRAIEDVARTVSRMREFYRPRELQAAQSRVQLNDIVRQVVELTRARWQSLPQERGVVIDLVMDLATELPEIMGADNEIRDALTNLIFNAVDAMPEGGGLTVRTRKAAKATAGKAVPLVILEVTDAGSGMDEETRRHCLEPFYTTKGERGTGLGLAMVYGMAQRHNAELRIDSTLGEGTTVAVEFPITENTLSADRPFASHNTRLPPLRLLVIDDDPLIAESLSEVLRRDGHEVTVKDDGQAGIDAFMQAQSEMQSFDAVVTDLGMPRIDGRRVASAIKTLARDTPVILLTGWGQRLLDDDEVPANVDRVLGKPPKAEELRRALAELVVPKLIGRERLTQ